MIEAYESAAWDMLYTNKDSVVRFFAVMSRFEYAVKKKGYIRGNNCQPNWEAYASNLSEMYGEIAADDQAFAAIDYLDNNPPKSLDKKMKWGNWKRGPAKTNLARAFLSIKQVRNNLFHGSKGDDKRRNDDLIGASLVVLEALLVKDDELRGFFSPYHS